MSDTRFFSWKQQPSRWVKHEGDEDGEREVVIVDDKDFQIECYERKIKLNDYNVVKVSAIFPPQQDHREASGQLKRGLVWDYLEIITIEDKKIEPTLTVNLCFNNRFYFGWLPLLVVLASCISLFIWKKVCRGKKTK